eukprot:TRINITY_DN6473_c0_g2_i1.p1 TRINITY_DN6473_c0_g2~~TRINITY_DN6473_c0_g2_i1.p1  ORF type:complete len:154 (+),score=8.69 TRINITY_DN6473_c0_g2_i1:251-712(+)
MDSAQVVQCLVPPCLESKPHQLSPRPELRMDVVVLRFSVHPPTAAAGLFYVTVELQVFQAAVHRANLQIRSQDLSAHLPRDMMASWLAAMNILAGLHFGSTLSWTPDWISVAMALLPVLLACTAGLGLSRRRDANDQHDALELVAQRLPITRR